MAEGVSFTGDGKADVSINVSNTGNADHGRGDGKAVEFAGNGGDDVKHSFSTNNGSGEKPGGKGEIDFVG